MELTLQETVDRFLAGELAFQLGPTTLLLLDDPDDEESCVLIHGDDVLWQGSVRGEQACQLIEESTAVVALGRTAFAGPSYVVQA